MTARAVLLLVGLLAPPCLAQWTGTIANRPVTCTTFFAPGGGDAAGDR
jgi:hypothetical protein